MSAKGVAKCARSRPTTTATVSIDATTTTTPTTEIHHHGSPAQLQSPSRRRPHCGVSPPGTMVAASAAVAVAPTGSTECKQVVGRRAKPSGLRPIPIFPVRLSNLASALAAGAISISMISMYFAYQVLLSRNGLTLSARGTTSSLKERMVGNLRAAPPPSVEARGAPPADRTNPAEDLPFRKTHPSAPPCDGTVHLDPSDISFTLATQASPERLWMVRKHCERWPGPVSVSVFTDAPAEEVRRYLTQGREGGGGMADDGCRPDQVHVATLPTSSFRPTEKDGADGDDDIREYPVNTLRNGALAGVRTSHVFYVDVDFWTSANLYDSLHQGFVRTELSNDTKLALVVPSFEFQPWGECWEHPDSKGCEGGEKDCEDREERCRRENMRRMPSTKDDLVSLIRAEEAGVFDPSNAGGFLSTRYMDWFNMKEGDLLDVPCITSNRYEPFVVVRYCQELPPYQESFTGYGKNKITNIMHMRRTGYIFSQVGGVFAIHFPHLYSKVRRTWNEGWDLRKKLAANHTKEVVDQQHDWTRYTRGRVDKMFVRFKRWLADEVPDEARLQMCEDAQNDDAKLWV